MENKKPEYNTWIRTKKIVIFLILTLVSIFGLLFSYYSFLFLFFIIPIILFGYIFIIISLTSFRFSVKGGDFQNKIHDLIIGFIENKNKNRILDIGCGSGNLAIKIAKRFPGSLVFGVDYWGSDWEYSKAQCENNSKLEHVHTQVCFKKGTASKLEFEDNSLDTVVSCLTFHEVGDVKEKIICLSEAIRVLKPSGKFIFFDLFLDPGYYPAMDKIKEYIKNNNGVIKEAKRLNEYFKLPFPLNNKKVLGYGVMIAGIKK